MCGFISNVNDFPLLEPLLDIAGYSEEEIREIIREKYLRPTDTVINLIPTRSGPQLMGATWWLATHENGSPNQSIASFNSKVSKVQKSRLHLTSPKSVRSIIGAQGFCEWQPIYKGGLFYSQLPGVESAVKLPKPVRKQQYLVEPKNRQLMLLGSVSKLRIQDGKPKVNTSVITLPPHQNFVDIHHKSFPLIIRPDELIKWLDPLVPWSDFTELLELESFRDEYQITPVDGSLNPIGTTKTIN